MKHEPQVGDAGKLVYQIQVNATVLVTADRTQDPDGKVIHVLMFTVVPHKATTSYTGHAARWFVQNLFSNIAKGSCKRQIKVIRKE